MISWLVRASVRHAGLVLGLALALFGEGLLRVAGAPLDVFPEFAPSQVVVQTEAPGQAATGVEALVTRPIEQAVAGLDGLAVLRSQSIAGLSVVTLLFRDGGDLRRHRQGVAERLAQAQPALPPGVVPKLTPLTSSASTVLGLGLTSATLDGVALRQLVDTRLRPLLLAVPGVADVNVFGGAPPQWQLRVDAQRLALAGLSMTELVAGLRQATGLRAAGQIDTANQRIPLVLEPPASEAGREAEALAAAVVAVRQGRPVLLGELGEVVRAGATPFNAAQIDGEPGIFLMVQGQLGANTRALTRALDLALASARPGLAQAGAMLHADLFRPADFIDTALGNVQRDVAIGAALVVAVLLLFLYDVRTALVSAAAIPLSLVAAVAVLQAFGVGLNIMVLGGLAIALGEVVDDAIIDCENILRRLRENRAAPQPRPVAAVVVAASLEVRASVVYATFIVALVFTPLLVLSGVAGRLFAPLGLAYIAAILASLLVSLTVTPALTLRLLGRARLPPGDPPVVAWLKPRYRRLLRAIDARWQGLRTVVLLAIAAGLGALPLLGGEFLPPLKEGHFIVHMTAVPGTSLEESLRLGRQVTEALRAIPGVRSVAQWVGRAENGADTFGTHYSELEVEIGQPDGAEQARILQAIRLRLGGDGSEAEPGFAGLQFAVNTFLTERIGETVSGLAADLGVTLYGSDLDALDRDARRVAGLLQQQPGLVDVQWLAPPGAPALALRLRPERLAQHGLSAGEVMDAVQLAFDGTEVGTLAGEGGPVPVVVTLPPSARVDPDQVGALALRSPLGRLVPLGELAELGPTEGRHKVLREGGQRVQSLSANLRRGQDAQSVAARLRQGLDGLRLTPGTRVVVTGAAEAQARARRDLLAAAALATAGVLALLLLAFGSLRHVLLATLNLPFALIGGVAAVLATGGWLSLGAVVGFVTLFGITLRNAIMLVSHCGHLVAVEGRAWGRETLFDAALDRLPSILMTALVTGLGLLPLALGSAEPGREIEGPMATVIVGGLVSSTLLNLLVLPMVLLRHARFDTPAGDGPAAPPAPAPRAVPGPV